MSDDFFHDEEVAALLQISVGALRNKVLRGDPLPPYMMPPKMRVRLWPNKEVGQWLFKFLCGNPSSGADEAGIKIAPRRRGRPPKFPRGK